jgi:metal-responsive CopG/Arc/MetJ family transcriptional regulator
MQTVQLTLDEDLVEQVDAAVRSLKTTRSAFARQALKAALARFEEEALERKHREGYLCKPVRGNEFQPWEGEPSWEVE